MTTEALPQPALVHEGFIRDLVNVCKPGIMVLLLISTGCPMIVAANGRFPIEVFFQTLLGGALLSASASCLNCIWDRDIDAVMERTKRRPFAAGRLDVAQGLIWSTFLGVFGFAVLWEFTNPAAALVALSGHLFYFIVYTTRLKRSTPQNIVIGGAAGAVPPIVGWCAVTGDLTMSAFLMFLIVFLWTPPHFWALALNRNDDYRRANIPMLPVVAGAENTYYQMLIYGILLLPATYWLVAITPQLGIVSMVGLMSLGAIFLYKIIRLGNSLKKSDDLRAKRAWDVFGFSLIYLGLFFFVTVLDAVVFS